MRLDQALAKLLPDYSRSRLQSWISENRVILNEQTVNAKQKVWGGESIQIFPKDEPDTQSSHMAENIRLNIVYEDNALIIVNKPAGLVCHPGNGNWQGTLLNALLHHAPPLSQVPRAGIVHRLDKDTSGLLVVAKTIEAQIHLVRQLQLRTIKRDYLAIVLGNVSQNGIVDAPIGRHPTQRTKMAITSKGKPARTFYRIHKKYDDCTVLECSLDTGRTHQIRVHMQSIGHPLIGDSVYGRKLIKKDSILQRLNTNFPRQALHARKITLSHPENGETLCWEAPLPDDLNALLQAFQEHFQEK
ncbi:ribosomal large subunit pseudouridine synthase D [Nitrosomonas sp. PY1]|nr:ribosomal large subunit pseudouridine synthase D [Nitrosomonas sp. PY1]